MLFASLLVFLLRPGEGGGRLLLQPCLPVIQLYAVSSKFSGKRRRMAALTGGQLMHVPTRWVVGFRLKHLQSGKILASGLKYHAKTCFYGAETNLVKQVLDQHD